MVHGRRESGGTSEAKMDATGTAVVTEDVARAVHTAWMKARMAAGWTLGPKRDDAKKEHPCLVPYDELSEEEKGYDYATAEAVVEKLAELGYEIRKR